MKKLLLLLIPILTSCSSYYYTSHPVSPISYTPVYQEEFQDPIIDPYPAMTLNNWNIYSSQWNSYLYNPYYISHSTFWYFNSPNNYTWNYHYWRPWRWYTWNYYGFNYHNWNWNYNFYNGCNYGLNNWYGWNWNYGYNIGTYNNIWINNITNNYFTGKSMPSYKKPLNVGTNQIVVEKKPSVQFSKPVSRNVSQQNTNTQIKIESSPRIEQGKQQVSNPHPNTNKQRTNTYQSRPQISNSRPQTRPSQNNYQQRNQAPRSTMPKSTPSSTPVRISQPRSPVRK